MINSGFSGVIFDNVTYIYNKGTPMEKTAFDRLSLGIDAGEFVAVTGGSGSGKSTFLQLLGGVLKPSFGVVRVDVGKGGYVGVVFQFPEKQFFAETVYLDLSFPLRRAGFSEEEIEGRVRDALSKVDLKFDKCWDRSPMELSTGEKRRIAIASVLVTDPGVIALDEPFAGLDSKGRRDVFFEMKRLCRSTGKTAIIATQDIGILAEDWDRVIVLKDGRVSEGDRGLFGGRPSLLSPLFDELKSRGLDIGDEGCGVDDAFQRIKAAAKERKKLLT